MDPYQAAGDIRLPHWKLVAPMHFKTSQSQQRNGEFPSNEILALDGADMRYPRPGWASAFSAPCWSLMTP